MNTSQQDLIKQEHQENPIIQTIEIKTEPQIDSEVIIQTIDLKPKETQQNSVQITEQPEVKKKRVQKRWSKKTILENRYEDEPTAVKIINITDANVYVSQPKGSKARRIPKRFRADNFDIQKVGRVIDGSTVRNVTRTDGYSNIEYIKAEDELIIDDCLPETGECSTGVKSSSLNPGKRKKIKRKSPKSTIVDPNYDHNLQDNPNDYGNEAENSPDDQNFDQYSVDHVDCYQIPPTEEVEYPTDLLHLQDYPSTSQTNVVPTKSDFQPAILKKDHTSDDPEDTADPTYQNPQIDSDDSDSDTINSSNSNYRIKDGKFTCVHCNMCFKMLKNFDKHECLICQYCQKVFTTKCAMKRHVLHIHTATDEIFECKDCNKTFKAKKYLETHIKSHEKIHECDNCGMKFGNTSQLNEHKIRHKNPEKLTCKLCDRKCASRSSLKFHMRIHDVDRLKNLKCDKCSFTTDDNRSLVKHQKSHAKQEEKFKMSTEWLKCEKCPARLKNKQSLNNHMYYVHSELSFQCNLCGIVVKTERNLKRHWKNIHEHDFKS